MTLAVAIWHLHLGEGDNLGAVVHGTGVPHLGEGDSPGAVAHWTRVPHLGDADNLGAVVHGTGVHGRVLPSARAINIGRWQQPEP